jgi:hypothetical protein
LLPQAWAPNTWQSPSNSKLYGTSSVEDDLVWAAAWLCRAEAASCGDAVGRWSVAMGLPQLSSAFDFSWNSTVSGATALLFAGGAEVGSAAQRDAMKVRCMPGRAVAVARECASAVLSCTHLQSSYPASWW